MIDNLYTIPGAIVNHSTPYTVHTKRVARGRRESLHIRSDIVSVRSLQRCPSVEPNIWPTGDQRLKGRKQSGSANKLLCKDGRAEVDDNGPWRPLGVHFRQISSPQAYQE